MIFHCDLPCIVCDPNTIGPGPNDPNNPFVNLSSEAPDADVFIGFGQRGGAPPLGSEWITSACLGWCLSAISQEDADQCALAQAVNCLSTNWPITTQHNGGPPTTEDRPIFYSFSQSGGFLCPDGTTFNFVTVAGLYTSVINQATADAEAYTWALEKASINYVCLGPLTPARACANAEIHSLIQVNSAHTLPSFDVTGDLPPGVATAVAVDGTSFQLSGMPTAFGDYTFHLRVTDNVGNTMEKDYTLTIVGISNTSLPDAVNGTPYSESVLYGGTPSGAVVWAVSAGLLPIGLTLDSSTGEISGTPTVDAVYEFTISATDDVIKCSQAFTITVATASAISFSALVWTVLIPGTPGLDEVIAPNDIPNDFIVYCIAAGDADASSVGSFSYTGPLVACNLNVNVTNWAPEFLGSSVPSIPIVVSVNAVPVLTIEAYADCPMVALFDFPFNIPSSVAATITVSAQSNRVGVGGFQGQFNAVFTLTPA